MVIPQAEIDALKEKNPGMDLRLLEHMEEQIIVRPATTAEYKRFKAMVMSSDPNVKIASYESLLLDTVMIPDRTGLMVILGRRPGLVDTFGQAVSKLSGIAAEIEAKKV